MLKNFFEELFDEAGDFFEDIWEHLLFREPKKTHREREVEIGGVVRTVRPAYLFAERIDNFLKLFFGLSIILSAVTATFLGFSTLSELLKELITTLWGRGIMLVIGVSYFVIALWKLLHTSARH